jgi:hypothetical protein
MRSSLRGVFPLGVIISVALPVGSNIERAHNFFTARGAGGLSCQADIRRRRPTGFHLKGVPQKAQRRSRMELLSPPIPLNGDGGDGGS